MKYGKLRSIYAFLLVDCLMLILAPLLFFGALSTPANTFLTYGLKLFFSALGICFFTAVMNRFFIARRFDPVFKAKLLSDESAEMQFYNGSIMSGATCLASKSFRGTLYAFNMVYRRFLKNNWLYGDLFDGYNFYQYANWMDIILSYVYGLAFAVMFMLMCVLGTYATIQYMIHLVRLII